MSKDEPKFYQIKVVSPKDLLRSHHYELVIKLVNHGRLNRVERAFLKDACSSEGKTAETPCPCPLMATTLHEARRKVLGNPSELLQIKPIPIGERTRASHNPVHHDELKVIPSRLAQPDEVLGLE